MKDTVEINLELFGAKFANLPDNEQAKFFKGLARELNHYESMHKAQLQFSFASNNLNKKDRDTLEEVLPMLWLRNEDEHL